MSVPKTIFIFRKNKAGKDSLVLKDSDLPLHFTFSNREYVVERTKSGKLIMTKEENA